MFLSSRTITFASLLSISAGVVVSGFGLAPPPATTRVGAVRVSTTTPLYGIRCENKYYQLEEMEDSENCTTELFLKADGGVLVGQTDGPAWTEADGWWEVRPGTNDFRMVLTRKYQSGSTGTDMGEFDYDIPRTFIGEMTEVGANVGITGVMHPAADVDFDADSDSAPGYFNMIDATDVREDRRSDARVSSSS